MPHNTYVHVNKYGNVYLVSGNNKVFFELCCDLAEPGSVLDFARDTAKELDVPLYSSKFGWIIEDDIPEMV